jgi:hypothetical protein
MSTKGELKGEERMNVEFQNMIREGMEHPGSGVVVTDLLGSAR